MRIAIPRFPGASEADATKRAIDACGDYEVVFLSHQDESLKNIDAVVLPGGASFGDYLRPGGLAKGSLLCGAIRSFAKNGGKVLGIGNGFQLLCELGLLPGTLMINRGLEMLSCEAILRVEHTSSPLTSSFSPEQLIKIPIASKYGCYFADPRTIREVEEDELVLFRYANAYGDVLDQGEFNGSLHAVAALSNKGKNVFGIMAHPERAMGELDSSSEGKAIFEGFLRA